MLKKTLAWNTITEQTTEWTEASATVTIPAAADDHVPALGLDISGVKKVAVEGGYDYTIVELDYVQVEKVPTATVTFVALDGTTSEAKFEVGEEIKYPALAASRDADVMWSLSPDEYVAVPETVSEAINVYAFASDVIGFENYYKADYAKYSLNLTVTDEVVFDGDKAMKYHNVGYQYQSVEPGDWATNWTNYYEFDEEGNIVALGGEEAPVWAANTYMTKRDGDEHSLALWTTPAEKSYRVSFKYFVPAELGVTVTLSPYTNSDNIWHRVELGKVEYKDSTFVIGTDTVAGEWLDGEIYFTSAAVNEGYDYLYIHVGSSENYTGDLVYFDDFTLTEVQYATFEIPEGAKFEEGGILSGNIVTVYAEADEEIVPPLVVDAEDFIIEAWVDANGKPVSEFVNGGAYKVAPAFIYGDCDGDGDVNTTDLAQLKLILAKLAEEVPGADCDADGEITTTDLAKIKLYLADLGELGPEA